MLNNKGEARFRTKNIFKFYVLNKNLLLYFPLFSKLKDNLASQLRDL